MRVPGISTEEAAKNLMKGVKGMGITMPALKAQRELQDLLNAETERMKKEHKELMTLAKKRLFYIGLLFACLAVYENCIRPDLERAVMKNLRSTEYKNGGFK